MQKQSSAQSDERHDDRPVLLLVADDLLVREVVRQVLEHAGYELLEASTPAGALALARAYGERIKLLLTDVVMPEMDGAELSRRLQSMLPDLVTVFMSGYAEIDVVRRMREASVIHIQKPFTVSTLLSRIAAARKLQPRLSKAQGLLSPAI